MNPLAMATKGKGFKNALRRARVIAQRYGLASHKMDNNLEQFVRLLERYGASATFPITAVTLQRNKAIVQRLAGQGIEFGIHGYTHIDHSLLTVEEQVNRLSKAISIFGTSQVPFKGFRCPYLRWNQDTLTALHHHRLAYDSSQGLAWDVLNGRDTPAYRHVLDFYGAQSANDLPALPCLDNGLMRIHYCLPDDEALIDRLQLESVDTRSEIWLEILRQTYNLGELFTAGLHPERIALMREPLEATLAQARAFSPPIWIARLDEIAKWWHERSETKVILTLLTDHNVIQVTVDGPQAVTVLARDLIVDGPHTPWSGQYSRVMAKTFTLSTGQRPVIGISPKSARSLVDFLRQQGYLIEMSEDSRVYPFYLERLDFKPEDERPLLAQIEDGDWPMLRLGRWPDGARSALCISGDIDALTLWDYSLRFLGN